MRLIIPVLLLLLGLGGGVGAGLMFGPSPEEEAEADAETSTDDVGELGADVTSENSVSGGFERSDSGNTEYVRLQNQFIVPVVRDGSVRSLVVMTLTVEVGLGQGDTVFQHEPRLRDSFLRVLFAHANAGGFDGAFTEAVLIDPLRRGLKNAAASVLGEGVRDVLIVDISRQDA
jgi:hypothetical protein